MKFVKVSIKILITVILLVPLIIVVFNYTFADKSPIKFFTIQSASMEPQYMVGGLIITQRNDSYEIDEVITFNTDNSNFITHRITAITTNQVNEVQYKTKGDANENPDQKLVNQSQVIGKVIAYVPMIGRIVGFTHEPIGFITIVLIPSGYVILSELLALIQELRKKKTSGIDKQVLTVLLICLTPLLNNTKSTSAYFSNSANSASNTFQAASSFIANHLVINEVLYDTSQTQNISGQGGSNRGEFIEIYNPTNSSVSVNNWTLEDNTSNETLPNVSIPPHGFLILTGATSSEFQTIWIVPGGTVFAQASGGSIGNGFANDGDRATLKDNSANIVDQISWGNDTTFLNPSPIDVATGHSLERNPDGVDTNNKNDFIDQNTPTPGT